MHIDAKISLLSLLFGISNITFGILCRIELQDDGAYRVASKYYLLLFISVPLTILMILYILCKQNGTTLILPQLTSEQKHDALQNASRAYFLGVVASLGLLLISIDTTSQRQSVDAGVSRAQFWTLGVYTLQLSLFHWSEYFVTALYCTKCMQLGSTTLEHYLLNHSPEYNLALALSLVEHVCEAYLFRFSWKSRYTSTTLCALPLLGLGMTLLGEVIRKVSIITAATNFNHHIQYRREADHQLVTHGIYSMWRHPSYVGWFLFSSGTQILLVNPICFVGYMLASWKFFDDRIYVEEEALLRFFGQSYVDYQKRVGIGIPFIKGCKL